jgi:undecaprenyl-diphosphatase
MQCLCHDPSQTMVSIDIAVLLWFNQLAHRLVALDATVVLLSESHLLKGGVIMTLFWWEWAREADDADRRREVLIVNLLSCLLVIVIARGMAHLLPFRERPISLGIPEFRTAYTMSTDSLNHWSSFPSDHAALFFGLATGIWMVSRRLGILAYVYVAFVICLPRIYLGVHYPSDILAGSLLGIFTALLAERTLGRHWRTRWLDFWWSRRRSVLYVFLFLLSYQIATLFDDVRTIGGFLVRLLAGSI